MGIAVCTIGNYLLHNHQLHHQLLLVFAQLPTIQAQSAINGQSIAYFDDGKVPFHKVDIISLTNLSNGH